MRDTRRGLSARAAAARSSALWSGAVMKRRQRRIAPSAASHAKLLITLTCTRFALSLPRSLDMTSLPPTNEKTLHRLLEALREIDGPRSISLLEELTSQVPAWIKAHLEMLHSHPSPSGIMRCRLQQWFDAKKMAPDQEIPVGWKLRQMMGIISEPLWLALFRLAGFSVDLPNVCLPCGNMIAHPDAVLDKGFPLELKSTTGVGFRRLLESPGVASEEPGHYAQLQLEIFATGSEHGLYVATPPDPGMLQADLRRKKRYGHDYELDPIYVEWIERDDATIEALLVRSEMLANDALSDDPPPREYDGIPEDRRGKRTFPCGYCIFLERCNDTYGYGEGIEFEE